MTGAIRADQDPCRRSDRHLRRRDRHHGRPGVRVEQPVVGNGNIPILSGNNVQIPVQVPVDICGNAVGLLGFANASCVGGAAALLDDSGN
jgi:ChpA-C